MTADEPHAAAAGQPGQEPEEPSAAPEFDVVVAGSGAAGMTAALTAARSGLSVVVIEKTRYFGGSTARSGGGIWLPGNEVLRRAGVPDSAQQARQYLASVAGRDVTADRQRAFLDAGPAMLELVRAHTPLRFAWVPGYADYYPEAPGGLAQGRSIEPVPLDGRVLGAELSHLNPPYLPAPRGVTITAADYRWLTLGPRHPRAAWTAVKVAGRLARGRLLRQHPLSLGQALAAGLRAGLAAAGVPVWLGTPLTSLLQAGHGRVTGVLAQRDGTAVQLTARMGVVVCSGGFERNLQLRERYQRPPVGTDWTAGSPGNTGDGIIAGRDAGAALALMDDAWWGPSIPLAGGPFFCLAERSLPGCILVNGAGERFVNEAAPYVDAVHAMYDRHTPQCPHIPAWLIFDQRYRNSYAFAGLPPGRPLPRRWYAAGAV
jgi:3-oxosteroid 1-dehydrogenase